MTDEFKERIRSRMDGTTAPEAAMESLREWGATRVESFQGADGVEVSFNTPLPGSQPIRSSVIISSTGEVEEATIRYGVLDASEFAGHPSNNPTQVQRLKDAVGRVEYDLPFTRRVDFGDAGGKPRPHLRLGSARDPNMETPVGVGDDAPVGEVIQYIIDTTETIESEFAGDYVASIPGMENAPRFIMQFADLVSGEWDVESAAPASITETELSLDGSLKEATVVFGAEGDVVRFSAEFGMSPFATEPPSDAEWQSTAEGADLPPEATAFVRGQSGKRVVNWDSARAGDTADADEIASALNSLSIRA